MPNLYNKLMAKDMPGAAPAPTARQMVQAPMGLRSAMRRYADGGETSSSSGDDGRSNQSLSFPQLSDPEQTRRNELANLMREMQYMRPEMTRPTPPPPPETNPIPPTPDRQYNFRVGPTEETYAPPTPDRAVMPEIYPQDYAGPRNIGTSQTQQVGPRTSYRQEADGTMTEIGYDGQPIAGYTPAQLAMHNATTGVTPSEFQYVWNGEGYDKVPTGAQIGYNPMENVAPQIAFNPVDIPTNGYNEPEVNFNSPEKAFDAQAYRDIQTDKESERLNLLKRALSGQGVGSLMESQRLAQLLQNLGYSK